MKLYFYKTIKNKKILFYFTLTVFVHFQSVPTVLAQEIIIDSSPSAAKIIISNGSNTQTSEIGTTPFKMTIAQFNKFFAKDYAYAIDIKKDGFSDYHLIVSNIGQNNININAALKPNIDINSNKKIDKFINSLFEAQRLIRNKNLDSALSLMDNLEKDYPQYSSIYEFKGGAYYLNKEFKKALSYYRKAVDINPENQDAQRMKVYLEKIFISNNPGKDI